MWKLPVDVQRVETYEITVQEIMEMIQESFKLDGGSRLELEFQNVPLTGCREEVAAVVKVISAARALAS